MNFKYLLHTTTLLFVAGSILLQACSSSGTNSTDTPTMTPTTYYLQLPASVQSESGWKITLSALDLQTTLGDTQPEGKMFLVGLVEIENLNGESDCIKSDQFLLQNKLQKIEMERKYLEAGKKAYSRDYPGTIIGQCLDANEKKDSLLVFDVPDTSEELSLIFQEQTILLGKIAAIRNPLPTSTPAGTAAVPPTETSDPTQAPIATVSPSETPGPNAEVTLLPSSTPGQEILTIENNADMAALFKTSDSDPFISEFAQKYAGRIIQFDGYIASMGPHGDFKTRFDFLIYTGDYGGKSGNALNFKFEDVNYADLQLTGSNIPDSIQEGQNLRITAKVKEYQAASGLFLLEPVSIQIR